METEFTLSNGVEVELDGAEGGRLWLMKGEEWVSIEDCDFQKIVDFLNLCIKARKN